MKVDTIDPLKINSSFVFLPPWLQEQKEREAIDNAITENLELAEEIGDRSYDLQKNEKGYLLQTEDGYEMQIDVTYLPMDHCGPAQFELFFHEFKQADVMKVDTIDPSKINSSFVFLPPWLQEQKEREAIDNAITENLELAEEIGDRSYDLQKNEKGYLLQTEDGYEMQIDVIYLPMDHCGPAQFELFFHEFKQSAVEGHS